MFRRSNSSSNIPLPKTNLFGCKDSRSSRGPANRRSQSTTRLSVRDSVASTSQLRLPRKSSLDRRSNNVGLPRTTPLTKTRAGSLQRTTPSSAISQRTNSSRGTTPTSSMKDRVTIQKLASDKKWVAEKYIKVQNFIADSSLFDASSTATIKPPSIKTFVFVTATLFKEIFPKIEITNENYKDVLPAQLKVLRYPGTLTNSLLKTVNTMHSWPQIIGMWSWLIDKVNITRYSEEAFIDYLDPEEKQKYLLKQNCSDFLIKRYEIFNNDSDSTEEVNKANEKYIKNLSEILDVDFEQFNQLQAEVQEKKNYRNKQIQDIEHLKAEKLRLHSEVDQIRKEIEQFHETDVIKESELDNELQLIQMNLKEIRERKESTNEQIKQLKEGIKCQPCTLQEKLSLLREINELKSEIAVKREKIEHRQNIKNKFDHMLTSEISKIQSIVIQWNRSLMELSLEKPELRKLILREKGFHDPMFLNEVQEVLEHKFTIENKLAKSLVKVESDLKSKEQEKQALERNIEELCDILKQSNAESLKLNEHITTMKTEISDILADLEQQKKSHADQMTELQEKSSSQNQVQLIEELKEKKDKLDLEVTKFSQKMISFLVDMHKQVLDNIKEVNTIRKNVLTNVEVRAASAVEKRKQFLELLQAFKDKEK